VTVFAGGQKKRALMRPFYLKLHGYQAPVQRFMTSVAFVPPKPKLLEHPTQIRASSGALQQNRQAAAFRPSSSMLAER